MGEYCVYCHTNKVNGKKYVGLTKQDPTKRWHGGYGYIDNEYFYNAIKKYGWDAFDHEIIKSGLTREEASELEALLILEWRLMDRNKGYNLVGGGYFKCGVSDDTRKKMSESAKKRRSSSETKAKISNALKNRPCSEETREKLRRKKTGWKMPDYAREKIRQVHLGRYTEAQREACMRRDNSHLHTQEVHEKISKSLSKSVSQFSLSGEKICEFDSLKSASEATGLSKASLSRCASGKQKAAGGFVWRYETEYHAV